MNGIGSDLEDIGLLDSDVSHFLVLIMQSGRRCITGLSQLVRLFSSKSEVATTNAWNSVVIPPQTLKDIPTSTGGAAFAGDIRATSGLGRGDGIKDHTGKWMQGSGKSPIQYIAESEPILVEGPVVASHGGELLTLSNSTISSDQVTTPYS